MNHMMQHDHQQMADAHTGRATSNIDASHAGHSVAMFRDKFWLSFVLTLPVLVWSTYVQRWFGYTAPSFPGSRFIPAILGTVIFFYGGLVFIRGAWGELADRKPGMMTLISLGIIVAFGTSLAGTFGLFELEVWWELASLITIMILGHWLEMRAISSRAARSTHLLPCSRMSPNAYRVAIRNRSHFLSCVLATSFWSGPGPAFRRTAWSLRASPMLTSR
jgi:Cu2+-exporting ATPase